MHLRTMTADDVPFGLRLKTQNNWNQIEADWRRQLELEPTGCFVAETAAGPVGTACACVFDDVAWINMVLVDQAQRGQGLGTALMRHVLQYLDERGVASIRLDATPLGQPVYAKLGFVGNFTLERYEGIPASSSARSNDIGHVEPLLPDDLPAVFALDEAVTKTRREKLLRPLYEADPDQMRKYVVAGRLAGYCMSRPGSNAWKIGPLQGEPEAGRALLLDAAIRFAGRRVYLDVPIENAKATHIAQALGLKVQRPFLRMSRGRRLEEKLEWFWGSFGPEKG